MGRTIKRREFLKWSALGSALCAGCAHIMSFGCRSSGQAPAAATSPTRWGAKARVARIYMGNPRGLWPKPDLNFKEEVRAYEEKFSGLKDELSDVEFPVDELVTSPEQAALLKSRMDDIDGILVIHLSLEVSAVLREILNLGLPTMVFAVPYSGHEWVSFGALRKQEIGSKMDCILSSDYSQLATAIRPFRAIRHFKESTIVNLSTRPPNAEFFENLKARFGTSYKQIGLDRMLAAYDAVSDTDARAEGEQWFKSAEKVIEPTKEEVYRSLKLALAFERVLEEEKANIMTVDCYGTMWDKTIKLPAYPCIGFARLNNLGLGGICESDIYCALTHILFQGLVRKPGFISDPTVDESRQSIVLAHCMGTPKMDGPAGAAAPYKLRTIMERREGAVPQVKMRVGQKVTQAFLIGTDLIRYFTGEILSVPDIDRGCRTKIEVKVDGDIVKLWQNWEHGLHRLTCYGDLTRELQAFSRFKGINLVDEAA